MRSLMRLLIAPRFIGALITIFIVGRFISPSYAATPSVTPTPTPLQLNADTLFDLVNGYRSQFKLPALIKDERICSITKSRAPEIANEIYGTSFMHAGFQKRDLPYWASENIIFMNSESAAFNWWINSPVHRSSIMGSYTYSCTSCSGVACAQIFTNFTPKNLKTIATSN